MAIALLKICIRLLDEVHQSTPYANSLAHTQGYHAVNLRNAIYIMQKSSYVKKKTR